jgi:hypothetical protein
MLKFVIFLFHFLWQYLGATFSSLLTWTSHIRITLHKDMNYTKTFIWALTKTPVTLITIQQNIYQWMSDHTNLSMLTALYTPRQLCIGWSRPSPNLRLIHLPHRFLIIATARMLTPINDKTENTVTSAHCNDPWSTTPWKPILHNVLLSCRVYLEWCLLGCYAVWLL